MPVTDVLLEAIIRRQVEPAAKPPYGLSARQFGTDKPHIGMSGRHIGVARVDDQRHAHGPERPSGELRSMSGGRGRQARPEDIGEIDPSLLEYTAFSEDPAATTAPFGPLPTVLVEPALAILVLEGRTDAVL